MLDSPPCGQVFGCEVDVTLTTSREQILLQAIPTDLAATPPTRSDQLPPIPQTTSAHKEFRQAFYQPAVQELLVLTPKEVPVIDAWTC